MPRRSTPFQRMLFHVQRQLSPRATVQESALLRDRETGRQREVDIVIRSGVGEHEILISLECLERKRRATVGWVEQMVMKHRTLPTDKLILVSASGFTASAREKAQALAIDTYSLKALLETDRATIVGRKKTIPWTWFEFHLHAVTLVFTETGPRAEYAAGPSTQLWSAGGDHLGTLRAYVDPLLGSWESFGERAAEFIGEETKGELGLEIRPKERFSVKDPAGQLHEVAALRTYISFEVLTTAVGVTAGSWRGTPVEFGSGDSPLGPVSITVMEPEPGVAHGAATIPDPDTGELEIVDLEPPQEPSAFRLIAQGGPLGFKNGDTDAEEDKGEDLCSADDPKVG